MEKKRKNKIKEVQENSKFNLTDNDREEFYKQFY